MVRRKTPACGMHFLGRGAARRTAQAHTRVLQRLVGLFQVAGRTGSDDVFPACDPTARAWHHMVKGQFPPRAAILATEFVPQKKIEARECHALLGFDVVFQHHDRGDAYRIPLASHHLVIFGDDLHPVQKHRLDRLLPGPERQRIIAERSEIGVQHKCRVAAQPGRFAHELGSEIAVVIQHRPSPGVVRNSSNPVRRLYIAAGC